MDFKDQIKEYSKMINIKLDELLPAEDGYAKSLYKSMRYSIFAGGKRLRPILALATCRLVGGNIEDVVEYACAIEMIHTFSLIHDDLPAIDDDDYRRGNLTNHKVFGEATAILAGDGLLNTASEIMIKTAMQKGEKEIQYLEAMKEIVSATGVHGMIAGELVDIESEGRAIDEETLKYMYANKTGKFIIAPIKAGAIIGGGSGIEIEKLEQFAKCIGLAFQIRDDILDIIGDQEKLGKDIGSDEENEKSTYVSIYGIEESKRKVKELSDIAIESLSIFGEKAEFLVQLARYLVNRES